jgi:hypothetical protein
MRALVAVGKPILVLRVLESIALDERNDIYIRRSAVWDMKRLPIHQVVDAYFRCLLSVEIHSAALTSIKALSGSGRPGNKNAKRILQCFSGLKSRDKDRRARSLKTIRELGGFSRAIGDSETWVF